MPIAAVDATGHGQRQVPDARCQAPQTGTSVVHVVETGAERSVMHLNTPT
ncbi:MAG: hypothetical protein RL215_99, partial [Planctomycetota bacterium]